MRGFVDLHCHYVPSIDDGARSVDEGTAMLRALRAAGFDTVVATPHMRPGMFDNTRSDLQRAFDSFATTCDATTDLPARSLSSEHYFDDVVFGRLLAGEGVPYPGGRAVLLEFYEMDFPRSIDRQLVELRHRGLLPVIAHPERYRIIWKKPDVLERLVDLGAVALLDTAALVGKYGREPRRAAEALMERGLYHAACSDAHRPSDVAEVERGIRAIEAGWGAEEVDLLLREGPLEILEGRVSP